MADLLGFKGFLNSTAPLNALEYKTVWKGDQRYFDLMPSDQYDEVCKYPAFYAEEGIPVEKGSDPFFDELKGCYDSEFDQVSYFHFQPPCLPILYLLWRTTVTK